MNSVCPRCQRKNPEGSAYCWFDGNSLASAQDGGQKLAADFIFPSGRRCNTLETFAQACYDEWSTARDMLSKDAFRKFFIQMGRHDLVRLAQEVMQEPNHDIGLSRFVSGLPVVRVNAPKIDIQPRRFTLGRIPGERREVELVLVNTGKGSLQGTVTVNEGGDWLSCASAADGKQIAVQAAKEQRIKLIIDGTKLQTSQSYVGQVMVVTSGGVAEVPIRFDVVAKPFAKAPFQGVRTPRELAEKMRANPKVAGPLLEAGDVERWFASNNWPFPVEGQVAKGVAGVQQFFEAMGLSKPPPLQLSQKELRFTTQYPDSVRFQVALQTASRKWVYGQVTSNRPWLKVLTPRVIGPQNAHILLEADPKLIPTFPPEEGRVHVQGNGGQKLDLAVYLDVKNLPRAAEPGRWSAIFLFAVLFVLLRLIMIPIADFHARGVAVAEAAARLQLTPTEDLTKPLGWLKLPWLSLLTRFEKTKVPDGLFVEKTGTPEEEALKKKAAPSADPSDKQAQSEAAAKQLKEMREKDFQYYFIGAFVRDVVKLTWWFGPLIGVVVMLMRSESSDRLSFIVQNLLPALVAGTVGGVLLSATLACVFLGVEIVPHAIWEVVFRGASASIMLPVWCLVATACWLGVGILVGVVVGQVPALRRSVMPGMQSAIGGFLRMCGLKGLEKRVVGTAA